MGKVLKVGTPCAWCQKVYKAGDPKSHGICPSCVVKHFPGYVERKKKKRGAK